MADFIVNFILYETFFALLTSTDLDV